VIQDPERCRARGCSAVRGWNTWGSCGFGQHKTVQTKVRPCKIERPFLFLLTPWWWLCRDIFLLSGRPLWWWKMNFWDEFESLRMESNLPYGFIHDNKLINFPLFFSHFSYSTFHWEFRETQTQWWNLCPRQVTPWCLGDEEGKSLEPMSLSLAWAT
jgi:hypothetical protein